MLHSINPFTGELIASRPTDVELRIESALSASLKAFDAWRRVTLAQRSVCVQRLGQLTVERATELANLMAMEMGKPIAQGKAELLKCAALCRVAVERADAWLSHEELGTAERTAFVRHDPLGPILGIMPWNFPFWQVYRFAVPALLAGNTAILKHASNVSLCAAEIERLFLEAGFNEGVFEVVYVTGSRAAALVADYRIAGVSLTGSEHAGSVVAAAAGKAIKPVVLELGGSNAFIVHEDANLERAIDVFLAARFQNSGQSCIAAKRLLLHAPIHDAFIDGLIQRMSDVSTGDPFSSQTFIGPLARIDLAEELQSQWMRSVEAGARVACGGARKDALVQPTLLVNVRPGMPAFEEETFGPLAVATRYSRFNEAVALSNSSRYGLGVSVFSEDVDGALARCGDFAEGAVFINEMVYSDPELPFGGVKSSGIGRELGRDGMLAFVNRKTVVVGR